MTTRLSIFSSPLLLGFDQLERVCERVAKGAEGYPPYNIEQTGEASLRITLAVAGFCPADLSVQMEDNQLVILGKQKEENDRVFIHRGIAARQFQRRFVLAEGIEVIRARLDNGLLSIDLSRPVIPPKVKTIPIDQDGGSPGGAIHVGKKE
ncbi:MAG: Hsp20 family protein [Proteobacteria bacterium]|nr:Hsp20 family protein [Pseudomonadota bacterium]